MLRVDGITAGYGRVQAVENVSLKLERGQIVCLLGANGAGKTTTLNCISAMVPLRSGQITFEGDRIDHLRPDQIVARGIVQVPEGREIFPELSVTDNLRLGVWSRRRQINARQEEERVYDIFPRLKERAWQNAGTLSGGEQQMLMIGRALMAKPKLLLLDEPSLGLSPVLVELMFKVIVDLNKAGLSVLLVEQNAFVALACSEYGYVLENGEIRFEGPSVDLQSNDKVREAYLGT